MGITLRRFWAACLFVLAFSAAIHAQVNTGNILGTLKDSSGAVLPGVSIQVTNIGTNVTRTVISDANGDYLAAALPPGHYSVTAEHPGFKKATVSDVDLHFDERMRIDLTLFVGTIEQNVEVSASVEPLIATDTASVGQTISSANMVSLPLNKRDYLSLALLTPGVTPAQQGSIVAFFRGAVQVNGAREEANNFLLDGMNNKDDMIQGIIVSVSLDGTDEFKVQSSTYSAEYGQGGGAQINIITKSGTDKFHGSLFEFTRQAAADARNFFAAPGGVPPTLNHNQFGGSLGGPIKRGKTFFFLSYEGGRLQQDLPELTTVPTLAERAGNFSADAPIYDPATFNPVTHAQSQFPGNIIPANRLNATSMKVLSLLPLPNETGALNFLGDPLYTDNLDEFLVRLDQQLPVNNSLMIRFAFYHGFRISPYERFLGRNIPGFGDSFFSNNSNSMVGWTKLIGANKVNELKFDFPNLTEGFLVLPPNNHTKYFTLLGIQDVPYANNQLFNGVPQYSISGIGLFGDGCCYPQIRWDRKYEFVDNYSFKRSRHAFKVGFDYTYYHQQMLLHQRESINYAANYTVNPQSPAGTGVALADMELGYPSSSGLNTGLEEGNNRSHFYQGYFMDDLTFTPRLTFNLGIRYQYDSPWTDVNGSRSSFNPVTGMLIYPTGQGQGQALYNRTLHDFAPRIGAAWRVTNKTVVRGGYGLFYTPENGNGQWALSVSNPPLTVRYNNVGNPFVPNLTSENPFPTNTPQGAIAVAGIDKNFHNGFVQQYNVNVERELTKNTSLEVGYLGTRGTDMESDHDINQPLPGPGPAASRRPYPNFSSISMYSSIYPSRYNSLQAKFQGQFSNGQSLLVSYTLSSSMDILSAFYIGAAYNLGGFQNNYDLRINGPNWGPSNFNRTHSLTAAYVLDTPFGHGKRWLSQSAVAGAILAWELNGIYTYGSGTPVQVTLPNDNSGTGSFADRPNLVPGVSQVPSNRGITNWINPAAYVVPPQYTFGNLGRNTVNGPRTNKLDFSINKDISLRERMKLRLGVEFYNIFNHPNFYQPGAVLGTPQFGQILQAYDGRDIQFGARFAF